MTALKAVGQGPLMPNRSSKRPRDPNQLAKLMVDIASGEQSDPLLTPEGKNAAAVLLGRRGGLKGGAVRAERLTAERRREIAAKAAQTRWEKSRG